MLKTKDGYAKVIGTSYQGSSDYLLLSNGDSKAISSLSVSYADNADKLDGYHENSFLRYRGGTSTDQEATLWSQIGIKKYTGALPDGLTDVYNYGSVISLPCDSSRFEIYASHQSSSGNGLYYRSGWNSDKKPWLKFIDSSNIGSQSVNYANSAGNANTVDGQHASAFSYKSWWHWSGQSGQPSWIWGGNSENNYYVYNPSNFSVKYATSAGSVAWNNVTGRPSTFAPSAHTHKWADITDPITKLSQLTNDKGFVTGSVSDKTITINGSSTTWSDTWRPITDDYKLGESGTSLSSLGSLTLYNDLLDSIPNLTDYYWANVKISASSSTTTSPTVHTLTATSSIRMGNILLEHTDEINNSANGDINLNYRNSGNVSLCVGGGNVGIGTTSPTQKLDVVGNIRATGNSYATHFYESSDKTLKKNIKSILSSTNIPKIREFDWKDTGEHSYGFIAQELEEQGYSCLVNEANGKKTVNYTATLALTVAKLQNLINIQNKKISNLTKELKALKYGRKKNS